MHSLKKKNVKTFQETDYDTSRDVQLEMCRLGFLLAFQFNVVSNSSWNSFFVIMEN